LALFKTQDKRKNKVKIYNPACEFNQGDLIYKKYSGKLPVGSKKFIEIEKGVVLMVVDIRTRFGLEEIKLSYEGTSEFIKYTQYLERQKIELLLPHKQGDDPEEAKYLTDKNDPRKKQDPLLEKDFNNLEKKLISSLNKESDFALVCDKILLKKNLKSLDAPIFDKIREYLKEKEQSQTTEYFVEDFVGIKPTSKEFSSYCFALNYRIKKDYKIDFQQIRDVGWGKWNLISVIYYMKRNSLVCEDNPLANKVTFSQRKNLHQRRRKFEEGLFSDDASRYYLTQREVSAGALRLRSGVFHVGDSIEIDAFDENSKKSYLLYYYREGNLVLGFEKIFEKYKALQGTIMTFKQTEDGKFFFNIRMTKKGTIADKIEFNKETRGFEVFDEKIAAPVFVNKSMFLESDVLMTVYHNFDDFKKIDTLNKLTHKIFLEFGIRERNYEIHILRLYHILDLIFPIELKLVEEVILSNPEFVPSEKSLGIVYLDSDVVGQIEGEEQVRRQHRIEEAKQKREELMKEKMDKELKEKDDIRKKREERRRKREEEMWAKDRIEKEREKKKIQSIHRESDSYPKDIAPRGDGKFAEMDGKLERKVDFEKKKAQGIFKDDPVKSL